MRNLDDSVVKSFGLEWTKFDQREADPRELETLFNAYFAIFPWVDLPPGAVGFDIGVEAGDGQAL